MRMVPFSPCRLALRFLPSSPLQDVFKRAEEKGIKIEVTEKFKDRCAGCGAWKGGCKARAAGTMPQAARHRRATPLPPPPQAFCRRSHSIAEMACTGARKHESGHMDPPPFRRLVDEGFNPTYGARPLRRAIMRLIEDCLAERILMGDIKEGDVVIMDVDPDGSIAVLAGDKKMRAEIDAVPAGIA